MHDTYIHVHAYMYICMYTIHTPVDFHLSLSLFSLVPWKWPKVSGQKTHLCLSDIYFISLCRVLISCAKNLSVLISALPEAPEESLFPCPSCSWSSSVPCECRTEAWDLGWLCEGAALCLLRLCRDPHNSPFVLKVSISAGSVSTGFPLSCFLFSRLLSSSRLIRLDRV